MPADRPSAQVSFWLSTADNRFSFANQLVNISKFLNIHSQPHKHPAA